MNQLFGLIGIAAILGIAWLLSSNRKAIRQQTEPLEAFRRYLTTYAFEQAFCHLSEQLIVNLEKHWSARQRKL